MQSKFNIELLEFSFFVGQRWLRGKYCTIFVSPPTIPRFLSFSYVQIEAWTQKCRAWFDQPHLIKYSSLNWQHQNINSKLTIFWINYNKLLLYVNYNPQCIQLGDLKNELKCR